MDFYKGGEISSNLKICIFRGRAVSHALPKQDNETIHNDYVNLAEAYCDKETISP